MMAPKTVVIIGGSFAGLKVAQGILKAVPTGQVKVIIINPSDKFYYCIAAPRIFAKPSAFSSEQYLIPIAPAFSQYGVNFELMVGRATGIDEATRTVTAERSTGSQSTVTYDYLVIASGSSTAAATQGSLVPFKDVNSTDLNELIRHTQQNIVSAKTIVVGGAGPIGLEFVGELAEAYPKKSITIVSATQQLLPMLKKSSGAAAEKILEKRGVKVIKGQKVVGADKQGDSWKVSLSKGDSLSADLYISAAGVIPNNSFIPGDFLDENGWVKVDEYFRVKSASLKVKNIYAIGDIVALPTRTVMKVDERFPIVVENLKADILGTPANRPTYTTNEETEKKKLLMFVPIGASTGTGQMMGMTPWGWMVSKIKGKDFFVSKAASLAGLA